MGSTEQANAALVHEYLTWMRDTRGRVPASVYDYAARLQQLLVALGPTSLGVVTTEQIEEWLNRPRRGGVVAKPATKAKEVAVVKSLYRYLCARHHVEHNPCELLTAPKVANIHPKPVAPEVWTAVWRHPSLDDEARVVLGLGLFGGLRRSEIVRLSPLNVHLRSGRLVGFVRKGGGDDCLPLVEMVGVFADHHPHLLPEPERFLEPLAKMVHDRRSRPRLLPWRERAVPGPYNRRRHALAAHDIDPESLNVYLKSWLRAVGRPGAFHPHQLRHGCASALVGAGLPLHLVKTLMNHTSIDITLRYVKVAGSDLADWRAQHRQQTAELLDLTEYQRHCS